MENNYRIVDSCGNCKNCVLKAIDYDDVEYHYCNLNMNFPKKLSDEKKYCRDVLNWRSDAYVEENGVCDKHERIADEEYLQDFDDMCKENSK